MEVLANIVSGRSEAILINTCPLHYLHNYSYILQCFPTIPQLCLYLSSLVLGGN